MPSVKTSDLCRTSGNPHPFRLHLVNCHWRICALILRKEIISESRFKQLIDRKESKEIISETILQFLSIHINSYQFVSQNPVGPSWNGHSVETSEPGKSKCSHTSHTVLHVNLLLQKQPLHCLPATFIDIHWHSLTFIEQKHWEFALVFFNHVVLLHVF